MVAFCKSIDSGPESLEGKETNILSILFMPDIGLQRAETALTEHLFHARHWLRFFTDPESKEEYNTISAFREVKVHVSVDTNLY